MGILDGLFVPRSPVPEASVNDHDKEEIGKVAGMGAGMLGGARLGQLVIPIPIVGSFAGAVVGGALGSEAGKRAGKVILDAGTGFLDGIRGRRPEADSA